MATIFGGERGGPTPGAARSSELSSQIGSPGNDTLSGSDGDVLYGRGGDDLLFVSAVPGDPVTTAFGGSGDDVFESSGPTYNFGLELYGGGGDDRFTFDTIQASTMQGGGGQDTFDIRTMLSGTISGDAGRDTITLGSMLGTVRGGGGDDVIAVGIVKGGSLVSGDVGNDTISVQVGSAHVVGGDGDDHLSGGLDRNATSLLDGGAGDDVITSEGHNTSLGGNGRDTLESTAFENTLTGGAGADRFVYGNLVQPDSILADTITDFSIRSRDVLDLSGLLDKIGASNDPFRDGFLSFSSSDGSTSVLVDPDGGGDNYRTLAVLQGVTLTQKDKASYVV